MPEAQGSSLIDREARGPLRTLASRVVGAYHTLTGLDQYDAHRLEHVGDLTILVLPSVANPKLLRTGALLAAQVRAEVLAPDARMLDLGTGSGIGALAAVRAGARAVGVDVNAAAVRCARINALVNHCDRAEFRHGDLFAPVAAERFDLVAFNPPFLVGAPRDARDAAWRAPDLPRRFAAELGAHLTPRGSALLLLSSFGDASAQYEHELRARGYALGVHARHRFVNESVTILRVRPS